MDDKTKRIAITGGNGFLGKVVVQKLKENGYHNLFVPSSVLFDLRDQNAVIEFYERARPDCIIHLAARVGGIGANRSHPGQFFFDNAAMGLLLLEYGRRYGIDKFVNIGTICSYPKFAPIPFEESTLWSGYPEETNAPYGLAKKMTVVQGQAYRAEYGMNVVSLLPVNIYGPGEHFDLENSHVIPALIQKCVDAKESGSSEIVLWGDGSPTREFLYVEDAAEGIVKAFEKLEGPDPVNLGTGQEVPIKELAEKIAKLAGFTGSLKWDTTKPNGQPRRCVSVELAKKLFGFEARWSLEDGLKETVEWFLKNRPDKKTPAFVAPRLGPGHSLRK